MSSPTYCSVQDFLTMFPQSAAGGPSAASLALTMASAHVRNYTQRELSLQSYTNEEIRIIVDRNMRLVGKVRQWPIVTFTSLSILPIGGVAQQTLPVTNVDWLTPPYRLFYYTGPLTFQSGPTGGYSGPWAITRSLKGLMLATYSAGYAVIPDDVRTACILLAQYYLSRAANAMGAESISVSAPSSSNSISFGRRSTLLDDAEQLLNAYVHRE